MKVMEEMQVEVVEVIAGVEGDGASVEGSGGGGYGG